MLEKSLFRWFAKKGQPLQSSDGREGAELPVVVESLCHTLAKGLGFAALEDLTPACTAALAAEMQKATGLRCVVLLHSDWNQLTWGPFFWRLPVKIDMALGLLGLSAIEQEELLGRLNLMCFKHLYQMDRAARCNLFLHAAFMHNDIVFVDLSGFGPTSTEFLCESLGLLGAEKGLGVLVMGGASAATSELAARLPLVWSNELYWVLGEPLRVKPSVGKMLHLCWSPASPRLAISLLQAHFQQQCPEKKVFGLAANRDQSGEGFFSRRYGRLTLSGLAQAHNLELATLEFVAEKRGLADKFAAGDPAAVFQLIFHAAAIAHELIIFNLDIYTSKDSLAWPDEVKKELIWRLREYLPTHELVFVDSGWYYAAFEFVETYTVPMAMSQLG